MVRVVTSVFFDVERFLFFRSLLSLSLPTFNTLSPFSPFSSFSSFELTWWISGVEAVRGGRGGGGGGGGGDAVEGGGRAFWVFLPTFSVHFLRSASTFAEMDCRRPVPTKISLLYCVMCSFTASHILSPSTSVSVLKMMWMAPINSWTCVLYACLASSHTLLMRTTTSSTPRPVRCKAIKGGEKKEEEDGKGMKGRKEAFENR